MTNYRKSATESPSESEIGRASNQLESPADIVTTTRDDIFSKIGEPRSLTSKEQAKTLISIQMRLDETPEHYKKHNGINSTEVRIAIKAHPELMWSLYQMEQSGGAPDIDSVTDDFFIFADCSAESPEGRRGLTYEEADEMAKKMGVEMITRNVYRKMQKRGKFDSETISWLLKTKKAGRNGTLFGGRDGDEVFVERGEPDRSFDIVGWRGMVKVPRR